MLTIGQPAPAFTLPETSGGTVTLDDLKGQWTVLYFYPKDSTPGCTTEACDFRDNLARLQSLGARVYGVSGDSLKSHQNFTAKYELSFPLLSDPEKTMLQDYGVYREKTRCGKTSLGVVRTTILLDPAGTVRHVWDEVKVKGHVDEVIGKLGELRG
jgi:thioredoxin-dependent peroxiredoxin